MTKLLSFDMLLSLYTSDKEHQNAARLADCMHGTYVVTNDVLYHLNPDTISYEPQRNPQRLNLALLLLLEQSMEALPSERKQLMDNVFPMNKRKTFMNNVYPKFRQLVRTRLGELSDGKSMDDYPVHHLHFRNGYLDAQNNTFHDRVVGEHYVTRFINRDYHESTAKRRNGIRRILKKVFPEKIMNYLLHQFNKCILGQANKLQETLFILGTGSTGKSTLMEILQMALGQKVYFLKLPKDFFEKKNSKKDKQVSTLIRVRPLLLWINEMSTNCIDGEMFKNCVDGKTETTKLYEDEFTDVEIKGMFMFTSNNMPNLSGVDKGTTRRVTAYQCERLFVDKENPEKPVDNETVFLKDLELKEKLTAADLNAVIDLLVRSTKHRKLPKEFQDEKEVIVNANDGPGAFIDSNLVVTKNLDDRIARDEMTNEYNAHTGKHLSGLQVISDLRYRLDYKGTWRHKGVKGCFVGVRWKTDEDDDTKDPSPLDVNVHPMLSAAEQRLTNENTQLKQQLEQLTAQMKTLTQLLQQHQPSHEEKSTPLDDSLIEMSSIEEDDDPAEEELEDFIQFIEEEETPSITARGLQSAESCLGFDFDLDE